MIEGHANFIAVDPDNCAAHWTDAPYIENNGLALGYGKGAVCHQAFCRQIPHAPFSSRTPVWRRKSGQWEYTAPLPLPLRRPTQFFTPAFMPEECRVVKTFCSTC